MMLKFVNHRTGLTGWGLSHYLALFLHTTLRVQCRKFHAKLVNGVLQGFVLCTQLFSGSLPLFGCVIETLVEL